MHRKKRNRIRLFWLILALVILAVFLVIRIRLFPLVRDMAVSRVTNEASNVINYAIDEQIKNGSVDYDNMVLLEKDATGNVTALKTNMNEVNRLKTQVLDIVNEEILDLAVDQIGVPIGNLVMPEFFSGRGFYLPVKVISIRSSDAEFQNQFSQAGINQTLHQILMNVGITMSVLTPAGTENVTITSQVVIAETVIVGNVPNSYVTLDTGKSESDPAVESTPN